MPTLTELQEKRGRLVTEARTALDAIGTNTDQARTAELEQRHDTIMADFDKVEKDIKREERVAQIEKDDQERREAQRPKGNDLEVRGQDGTDGQQPSGDRKKREAEYRDAFYALARTGFDASELPKEQRDLIRRGTAALDTEQRVQVAGTPIAGGFTVPRTMADQIVQVMKDWGPMYDSDVCTIVTTGGGNEFDIPTNDDTASTAAALAEGADVVNDGSGDVQFGSARLDAYVYATPFILLSFELMQDSAFDLEAFLADAIGTRCGRQANTRLTTGSGTNQPNGVVTAVAAAFTAASATAIASDELLNLQHSVNAAYRRSPKCRWMFPDTTLLAIRKMKDGMGNYLWQMGDIRAGAPNTLLEKPYSINDDVPAIATTAKSVLFGDFSKYWVRKVGSPLLGTVRERFWPKVGMAGLIRFDGELVDQNAIKAIKQA